MTAFEVKSRNHTYPIIFGESCQQLSQLNSENTYILCDKNTKFIAEEIAATYTLSNHFILEIVPGEESKSLAVAEGIMEKLLSLNADRTSTLVCVGGGVVGDLGGFVASNFMRGIKYFQVPTSLMAQVDAAIGGKVAVNLKSGKNLVGSFYPPQAVFVNPSFLKSLSPEELLNGMAEVVKYGLTLDIELLKLVEKLDLGSLDLNLLELIISKAISCKVAIVNQDEYEQKDIRIVLNFGHTIGHALEHASNYQLSHGSAVALGMLLELDYFNTKDSELYQKTYELLSRLGFDLKLPQDFPIGLAQVALRNDKKGAFDKLKLAIPDGGGSFLVETVEKSKLCSYLENRC